MARPRHAAFLANLFDDLGRWWKGLPLVAQTIVVVSLAAVLTSAWRQGSCSRWRPDAERMETAVAQRLRGVSPEEVRDFSDEIGHELHSGGLDQVRRTVLPESTRPHTPRSSSRFCGPNDPIAVSKPMCSDCRSAFASSSLLLSIFALGGPTIGASR